MSPRSRLRNLIAAVAAALACVLIPIAAAPAAPRQTDALPRSGVDRADDVSGAQVHALYVLPSDGADRALDTGGTLGASISNFEHWLVDQTGGKELRLDTWQGQPDISFVRIGQTDADLAAHGLFLRDAIEAALHAAGFDEPGKIYAVYYDGSNGVHVCGGGAWPPTLVGDLAALYLRATYNSAGSVCYDPSASPQGLQLMDLAILHEVLHTMGVVARCAPHFTAAGHVSDSNRDLMYAGPEPWYPDTLDVGRDDYYGAHVPGCLDLADSGYLVNAPTPPPPPHPPPTECVVPRVSGKTLASASAAIRGAHCAVGTVSRKYSPTIRRGRIAAQTPRAGAHLSEGGAVNLVVSRGRRPK